MITSSIPVVDSASLQAGAAPDTAARMAVPARMMTAPVRVPRKLRMYLLHTMVDGL